MKKFFKIFGIIVFFGILSIVFLNYNSIFGSEYRRDYVPDEITAIKVAEAIWLPIYGKEIYEERPFKAKLIRKNVWLVYGTLHTRLGGVAVAEIQKSDCKILKVYHEK